MGLEKFPEKAAATVALTAAITTGAQVGVDAIDGNNNSLDKFERSEKVKTVSAEEMQRGTILGEVKDGVVTVLRNVAESGKLHAGLKRLPKEFQDYYVLDRIKNSTSESDLEPGLISNYVDRCVRQINASVVYKDELELMLLKLNNMKSEVINNKNAFLFTNGLNKDLDYINNVILDLEEKIDNLK